MAPSLVHRLRPPHPDPSGELKQRSALQRRRPLEPKTVWTSVSCSVSLKSLAGPARRTPFPGVVRGRVARFWRGHAALSLSPRDVEGVGFVSFPLSSKCP